MKDFLVAFDKFQGVSDAAKQAFVGKMDLMEVEKGHLIVREGQVSEHLYYFLDGSARSYYTRENREITVSFTLDGEFVTAMHSFITRKPSYEYIETLEKSKILKISHAALHECFGEYPELERTYRMILEKYYIVLEEHQIFSKFKNAKERYLELMENRPKVIQKASVGHIASYLDMTIETLSRTRAKI